MSIDEKHLPELQAIAKQLGLDWSNRPSVHPLPTVLHPEGPTASRDGPVEDLRWLAAETKRKWCEQVASIDHGTDEARTRYIDLAKRIQSCISPSKSWTWVVISDPTCHLLINYLFLHRHDPVFQGTNLTERRWLYTEDITDHKCSPEEAKHRHNLEHIYNGQACNTFASDILYVHRCLSEGVALLERCFKTASMKSFCRLELNLILGPDILSIVYPYLDPPFTTGSLF